MLVPGWDQHSLVPQWGENPPYPPYSYVALLVGVSAVLGAIAELLPTNARVLAGLFRAGSRLMLVVTFAGGVVVVLVAGGGTSW